MPDERLPWAIAAVVGAVPLNQTSALSLELEEFMGDCKTGAEHIKSLQDGRTVI